MYNSYKNCWGGIYMRISLILTLDYTSWEHQSLTKLIFYLILNCTWWVKSSCGCRVEIESHLPTYLLPSPSSSKSQPSTSSSSSPNFISDLRYLSLSLSLSPSLAGRTAARRGQARPARGQERPARAQRAARRGQGRPGRGQGSGGSRVVAGRVGNQWVGFSLFTLNFFFLLEKALDLNLLFE